MPQFTYDDRMVLAAEATLWCVVGLLKECEPCGEWTPKIKELLASAENIARSLQHYNDQWEEE